MQRVQSKLEYNEMYFAETILQQLIEPIELMPTEYEENFNKITSNLYTTDCQGIHHDSDYESDGRISLAFEKLTMIPKSIADTFALSTKILDLSHNNIGDLKFLTNFTRLNSLILDKNGSLNEKTLPYLPSLKLLWLNHCDIVNITKWIRSIKIKCPRLNYLSLLGNPGATSLFNGGTVIQHNVYRLYVIENLPALLYLDDTVITESQRAQAKSHRYLNGLVNIFSLIGQMGNTRSTKGETKQETTTDEEDCEIRISRRVRINLHSSSDDIETPEKMLCKIDNVEVHSCTSSDSD